MFFAHSTEDRSRSDWQLLSEHLADVAEMAAGFASAFNAENAARLAGLLHDLGKYNPDFQAYIDGAKLKVDHSTAGAATILELAKTSGGEDRLIAQLIAYAIAGHHTGLPDKQGETFSTLSERLKAFDPASLDAAWKSEICAGATGLLPSFVRGFRDRDRMPFQIAFLGRMLFSCLVDADFKDTEAFYARTEGRVMDREWPAFQSYLPDLIARFDQYMGAKRNADTQVNRLRGDILHHVRSRASNQPGLFTLTVPTGGGKTLASLGFALDHARAHGHERIIYAIPFAGAWIETKQEAAEAVEAACRPSRRGVDRNWRDTIQHIAHAVAPRAGAWIETRTSSTASVTSESPLAQGRGSKQQGVSFFRANGLSPLASGIAIRSSCRHRQSSPRALPGAQTAKRPGYLEP